MKFSKMHGLGNDFMVIDAVTQKVSLSADLIKKLSNRHKGIGFDQLLIVEPTCNPSIDFNYRIFNANGVEVEQCGNGARCFALFVRLKGLTEKSDICVSTKNNRILLNIKEDNWIRVNMGEPLFDPNQIPFLAKKTPNNRYNILLQNNNIIFSVVSIGNPHCVIQVKNVKTTAVEIIGSILESHPLFPEHVNVGFMEIVNPESIRLRVYERGVGETQACGSGACAAVASGIQQGLLMKKVRVTLNGGIVYISWNGIGHPLFMTGSATYVYDGFINLYNFNKTYEKS
ncbi:diaminopimelate epimerase [Candidatus Ishikawella capsulata]|uniref:Diaminopimelate epimerase n=1 Tax=Candidatus Ishikawaella capsulata Mpkobe TaxID=476281 RepID=C5WDQ6_9ENTR|nr:diaminopimelate epimerase [Candidatus Ishikawaella capsulata]BAH83462.1 diaminopimelate epimerase [Candidatus Ishikawaella capsulata Mpkobe]